MPRVIHFDIHAGQPERAIRFYQSVFGWKFTAFGTAPVEYWVVKTGEADQPGIDGGMIRRRAPVDGVAITAYVCTIAVADLDRYLMKVATSGSQLSVIKRAIRGVGWLAYCKDTEANLFGMLEADAEAK